jgi:hypothetical protein
VFFALFLAKQPITCQDRLGTTTEETVEQHKTFFLLSAGRSR